MNQVISFVRLDFITIKPYLTIKNFLLTIAMAFLININPDKSALTISILMANAVIYVSFPFAVCETNGIDALYVILSINRRTVVSGRYLFALAVNICSGLMAYILVFFITLIMRQNFDTAGAFITMLAMLLICSMIQAAQLPFFFKLGYTKAKLVLFLPFISMFLIVMAFTMLIKYIPSIKQLTAIWGWLINNPLVMIVSGAVIGIGFIFLSYRMSCKFYLKRDF